MRSENIDRRRKNKLNFTLLFTVELLAMFEIGRNKKAASSNEAALSY